MLCLYVGYLLADLAWYNIEFNCNSSINPVGIFFSRFFASIFAFVFGIGSVPVGIYVGFYAVKWILLFGCAILCSFSNDDSSRVGILVIEETTIVET